MPSVFTGWMRTRSPEGVDLPAELVHFARKAMGALLEASEGMSVAHRRHDLPDGSIVEVALLGGQPIATITPASVLAAHPPVPPVNLWLPRGFVVYPAWHDASAGVGLPVIADPDAGPYDPSNLDPGMDRSRWTAGGPCGEVLLSPDKEAGYPPNPLIVSVPLLYHPTLGPVLHVTSKTPLDAADPGAWAPYRIALEAPLAHYADEDAAAMRTLFEAVNTDRSGAGLSALNLPARGFYHPGQVACSLMQAAGTTDATSTSYPATYHSAGDRLTKDGFTGLLQGQLFTDWSRNGSLTAGEVRAQGGVDSAMTAWLADPDATATLHRDTGASGVADAGVRGGYLAVAVSARERWIQAGNQSWQSPDTTLPPLSWMGFASLNLAWETYPAQYDPGSDSAPIVAAASFTDSHGEVWLRYPRKPNATAADREPALSRHIFCRGRAIALAPRGGLVWGACVQTVGDNDRLIALVHHPEDQGAVPAGSLRVWWADVPKRALRLDPQQVIVGEAADDPWGWRGGQRIDLSVLGAPSAGFVASGSPNSLKYASQWRFAPDGSRAVCLRDYGAQADYALVAIGNLIVLESNNARAVELVFNATPTDLTTTLVAHEYTAGPLATPVKLDDGVPPLSGDRLRTPADTAAELWDGGAYPLAVDYAADGSLLYAYSVTLFTGAFADTDPGHAQQLAYRYAGIGSASATHLADLGAVMLHGANFETPGQQFEPVGLLVADVRSGTFVGTGLLPRFAVDTSQLATGPTVPTTATDPPCNQFTSAGVDGVRWARQGAVLGEAWHPNPDGALWYPVARCSTSEDGRQVWLPRAVSAYVQTYCASRFGEAVCSYQVSPMPRAVLVAEAAPSDADCGCQLTQAELAGSLPMHWLGEGEVAPRGGGAWASVTLPSNDWLIYAKVV